MINITQLEEKLTYEWRPFLKALLRKKGYVRLCTQAGRTTEYVEPGGVLDGPGMAVIIMLLASDAPHHVKKQFANFWFVEMASRKDSSFTALANILSDREIAEQVKILRIDTNTLTMEVFWKHGGIDIFEGKDFESDIAICKNYTQLGDVVIQRLAFELNATEEEKSEMEVLYNNVNPFTPEQAIQN